LYGLVMLPGAFREILAVQQASGASGDRLDCWQGWISLCKAGISVMKQQRVEAPGRCRH
jgi:hypothetical protein